MWSSKVDRLSANVVHMRIEADSAALSYAEVLRAWERDAAFRVWFNDLLAQAPFRAIARHGISKLARSNKAQPITRAAVGDPKHGHVFRRHSMSVLLNRQKFRPGLQANRRAEPQ